MSSVKVNTLPSSILSSIGTWLYPKDLLMWSSVSHGFQAEIQRMLERCQRFEVLDVHDRYTMMALSKTRQLVTLESRPFAGERKKEWKMQSSYIQAIHTNCATLRHLQILKIPIETKKMKSLVHVVRQCSQLKTLEILDTIDHAHSLNVWITMVVHHLPQLVQLKCDGAWDELTVPFPHRPVFRDLNLILTPVTLPFLASQTKLRTLTIQDVVGTTNTDLMDVHLSSVLNTLTNLQSLKLPNVCVAVSPRPLIPSLFPHLRSLTVTNKTLPRLECPQLERLYINVIQLPVDIEDWTGCPNVTYLNLSRPYLHQFRPPIDPEETKYKTIHWSWTNWIRLQQMIISGLDIVDFEHLFLTSPLDSRVHLRAIHVHMDRSSPTPLPDDWLRQMMQRFPTLKELWCVVFGRQTRKSSLCTAESLISPRIIANDHLIRCSLLTSLAMNESNEDFLRSFECPVLTTLTIYECTVPLSLLIDFVSRCPHLQQLTIHQFRSSGDPDRCFALLRKAFPAHEIHEYYTYTYFLKKKT